MTVYNPSIESASIKVYIHNVTTGNDTILYTASVAYQNTSILFDGQNAVYDVSGSNITIGTSGYSGYSGSAVGIAWGLTGNAISGGQFLGTTNGQDLVFKSDSVQVGVLSNTNASVLFGLGAIVGSFGDVAIGYNAQTLAASVAIGYGATADSSAANSVAIGTATNASNTFCVAIGNGASAIFSQAISIGNGASSTALGSIAIGSGSSSGGSESIAIGVNATSAHTNSISLGTGAVTAGPNEFVFGNGNITNNYFSGVLLGNAAYAGTVAFGPGGGTGPVLNLLNATDFGGLITFTTGTSPAAGMVFEYTYANPFPNESYVVFTPASGGSLFTCFVGTASNAWALYGNLTASTTYSLYFIVNGY
jgi:hypothetical protein